MNNLQKDFLLEDPNTANETKLTPGVLWKSTVLEPVTSGSTLQDTS